MQQQARIEGDEPEQHAPLTSQQLAPTSSHVPLVSGNDGDEGSRQSSGDGGGGNGLSLAAAAPPPPSSLPPSSASARVFPEQKSFLSTATATAQVTLDVGGKGDGGKPASKGETAGGSFFRRRRASSSSAGKTAAAGNADADVERSADESRLDVPSDSEASSTDGESSGREGGGIFRGGTENDGGGTPRRGSGLRAAFGGGNGRLTSIMRRRQPARVAPGGGENVEAGGGADADPSYESSSSVASSASSFSTAPYAPPAAGGGGGIGGRGNAAAAGFAAAGASSSSPSAAAASRRRRRRDDASSSASNRNNKASVFDATTVDHRPRWKKRAAALVDGLPATLAISFITVVAIFLDDLRLAALPSSGPADRACEVIAGTIFVLYLIDTAVGSLVRPGYFGRLYFWIDAVATFSMALEVPSLVALALGHRARPAGASVLARGVPDALDARARQITKVARILRLMRIVKLVQTYVAHQENASFERELLGGAAAAGAGAGGAAGAPGGSGSAASFASLSASSSVSAAGGSASGSVSFSSFLNKNNSSSSSSSKKKKWWTTPPKRSRVGQRLSDLSASRVVIGVLALLLAIPGFNINSGLYGDYPPLAAGGLWMLHDTCARVAADEAAAAAAAARASGLSDEAAVTALASAAAADAAREVVTSASFAAATDEYRSKTAYTLFGKRTSEILALTACGVVVVSADASTLSRGRRSSEIAVVRDATPAGCIPDPEDPGSSSSSGLLFAAPPPFNASCSASMAVLDVRWNSQITATLNLVRTAFIVAALALGITLMQRDAARLVLRPMERMLSKVRAVAENPLATKRARLESRGVPEREKLMETRILENAINKICSLLAVGFGDAGAEVIAGNMRSGGELDPVVPGRRVAGIFGFCDIRQFTDATEVLQEEVMGFVNTIARVVHREVSLHGGAPNKNIGDAFLLVWKFPEGVDDASLAEALKWVEAWEEEAQVGGAAAVGGGGGGGGGVEGGGAGGGASSAASAAPGHELDIAITLQKARRLADQALASFLTIQAALRRSSRLRELTARSDVQERLPGFGVRMGFGLHVGWAIEGAIGSEYKIDASYLSPNVNMASRLEAATKQFGTSLLMSGDFARLLSPAVRARTRQIDVVTVKGSAVPMSLHTYDFEVSQAPGPRLVLEEGVLQMQQQQQQAGFADTGAGEAAAQAAAAAAALVRQQQQQKSFRAVGGRYPSSRAHGRLDADALLAATDGGDADDAETFSHRPYASEFEEHPDLASTWAVDRPFLDAFARGLAEYRMGRWEEARRELERTLRWPKGSGGAAGGDGLPGGPPDGPSAALLRFMESHNFVAPKAWRGFRELTEK